jgi:hypothetical protein
VGAFRTSFGAVVLGTGLLTMGLLPDSWSGAIPFGAAFIAVTAVAGLASLTAGFKLWDVIPWVEDHARPPIERRLRAWLSADVEAGRNSR